MNQEDKIIENLKKCPSFDRCNQNLCPLDPELHLRGVNYSDKCRWMREPLRKKINGREFVSGGGVMLDGILNFVPRSNLKWLNESTQKRWLELKKDGGNQNNNK